MQTEPFALESACLTSHFEDKRVAGKIILKAVWGGYVKSGLEETRWDDSNWLGAVTFCCEHGSEHSGYIMCYRRGFLRMVLLHGACYYPCLACGRAAVCSLCSKFCCIWRFMK